MAPPIRLVLAVESLMVYDVSDWPIRLNVFLFSFFYSPPGL